MTAFEQIYKKQNKANDVNKTERKIPGDMYVHKLLPTTSIITVNFMG